MKRIKKNFKEWCIENNRQDLLDRWDYSLNEKIPSDVSYIDDKRYYFKCPKGIHESTLSGIVSITKGKLVNAKCAGCGSFAQYIVENFGEKYFQKIWNKDNTINPWTIGYKSPKEAIFNCSDNSNHKPLKKTIENYTKGQRCPYCNGRKICKENSLASIHPEVLDIWSEKNDKSPYEYAHHSRYEVWWKCSCGKHNDYKRMIYASTEKCFRCPSCSNENNRNREFEDLTGKKFGRLTVLSPIRKGKKNNIHWKCLCDCGNMTEVLGSHLKRGETKSCGCIVRETGEKTPGWKGGKTPKLILARNNSAYEHWRNDVYKKDWYTCQCCGFGRDLRAHHILNFSEHEDLRYDIGNGITLCKNCHDVYYKNTFHSVYGTKNNTPTQLEEYINSKRKTLNIKEKFSMDEYLKGRILKPQSLD